MMPLRKALTTNTAGLKYKMIQNFILTNEKDIENINLASFALSRIQTEVSAREFSHCVILCLMDSNVLGDLLCSDGL